MLYIYNIYMVTWIHQYTVSINIPAPAGSVMGIGGRQSPSCLGTCSVPSVECCNSGGSQAKTWVSGTKKEQCFGKLSQWHSNSRFSGICQRPVSDFSGICFQFMLLSSSQCPQTDSRMAELWRTASI